LHVARTAHIYLRVIPGKMKELHNLFTIIKMQELVKSHGMLDMVGRVWYNRVWAEYQHQVGQHLRQFCRWGM
jgi:hypothetical protein